MTVINRAIADHAMTRFTVRREEWRKYWKTRTSPTRSPMAVKTTIPGGQGGDNTARDAANGTTTPAPTTASESLLNSLSRSLHSSRPDVLCYRAVSVRVADVVTVD